MEHNIESQANMTGALVLGTTIDVGGVKMKSIYKITNYRRKVGCECNGCNSYQMNLAGLIPSEEVKPCEFQEIAWTEEVPNIVTTGGKNDLLTQYFKGSSYTAAWYVGLIANGSFSAYAAGDTMASHTGWAESTVYSNSTRVAWSGGTASAGSIDNSGAQAAFNINGSDTVRGAFLTTGSAKSGTTGILYGEADFSQARAVLSGDTLNVTVTLTAS